MQLGRRGNSSMYFSGFKRPDFFSQQILQLSASSNGVVHKNNAFAAYYLRVGHLLVLCDKVTFALDRRDVTSSPTRRILNDWTPQRSNQLQHTVEALFKISKRNLALFVLCKNGLRRFF